jgi:hypothetical protein
LAEVSAKEITLNKPIAKHGEMLLQVGDRLLVDLDDMELVQDVLHHVLGQDARTCTHFDDALYVGRQLLNYALGYVLVSQEMLA